MSTANPQGHPNPVHPADHPAASPEGVDPSPRDGEIQNKAYLMETQNAEVKQQMVNRLHRIEGQVRGVAGMVEKDRNCREILQQLTSIRSAMNGAITAYLQEYARQCVLSSSGKNPQQQEQILSELITMLSKAP